MNRPWVEKWSPDVVIGFQMHHYWKLISSGIDIPRDMGYAQIVVITDTKETAFVSGIKSAHKKCSFQTLSLLNQLIRNRIKGMPDYPASMIIHPEWNSGETLY